LPDAAAAADASVRLLDFVVRFTDLDTAFDFVGFSSEELDFSGGLFDDARPDAVFTEAASFLSFDEVFA
jgi:hypothetical protein